MTQPPDDQTRRFDAFRDDDSTRAMPPVGSGGDDDSTRAMPPVGSGGDDDSTRAMPPVASGDDDTRYFPFADDATRQLPGRARGAATPVPPVGAGGGYGGGSHSAYEEYEEYEEGPPDRSGRRLALIIGGIVFAILLVIGGGYALGSALFGGSPTTDATVSPPSATVDTSTPTESASPSESVSPPPPEGPGPRVLDVSVTPQTVDCTQGGTGRVQLSWRVTDAHRVDVSMDGNELQQYAPEDSPVSVEFPCDGQAHKYQVTAFSNNDRQSQPTQVTVRPQVAPASPSPTPPLLFPSG